MESRHYPIHLAGRAESRNGTATIICALRRLRSATGLGALWFALVFALSPSSLEAECAQWDLSGPWGLKQSDGNLVHMELGHGSTYRDRRNNMITTTTSGSSVHGTASYSSNNGLREGDVKGTAFGNKFKVYVIWRDNKDVGHWDGTILPSGIIQGSCSSEKVRSYKATFISDRPMICMPAPKATIPHTKFVILKYFPDLSLRSDGKELYQDLQYGSNTRYPVIERTGGDFGDVTIKARNGKLYTVPAKCTEDTN